MSTDEEGRNSWQTDRPEQEWIPLRDQEPSGKTLQVQSNVGSTRMRTFGDGGHGNQKDAMSAWAAQRQP